ncbi:MAG TPA: YggS family pyridoxal phosphate-dependent enzyme [Negativicutes bacterium]|jgi:hypothetical protein
MSIAKNITQINHDISSALARRNSARINMPGDVKLVAVTKNHPIAVMREAILAGVTAVGENRVQEAHTKYQQLDYQPEWHLIGHLQTNKVRQAVSLFQLIHSVDSERLASEIDTIAAKIGKRQDVLIQVNVADEDSKFGISPEEVIKFGHFISNLEHVHLCGLMTVAPFYEEAEEARPVFCRLYQLFMELRAMNLANTNLDWLSMGMTNDYIIAVEEGANLVRIGTGIFGTRQY